MNTTHTPDVLALDIPGLAPGLHMQLHPSGDQIISVRLRQDRCWEPYETALTVQHLYAGDVYVDVGANIGYYSLVAAHCVGAAGRVIAYEPDPENFALLTANVALNRLSQVSCFPYALSDHNTNGTLFLSPDNFGDHRVYASPGERHTREITLVKGDEHLAPLTTRIDFLKVDTQGAEYFVLQGLFPLLVQNRNHLRMIVEICPYGIRHSGACGHDVVKLLDALGMHYYIIDHLQHRLIPAQAHHLDDWIRELAEQPLNEGFINLFVTPPGYAVNAVIGEG